MGYILYEKRCNSFKSIKNRSISMEKGDLIFVITLNDLQNEAIERIGRQLTDDEIDIAKKGIAWGIANSALDITYNTIFTEMIKNE